MRLLALQMEFDQIHQHSMQVAAELGGRLEVLDFCFGSTCAHDLSNAN
jgi:hypothetical protein